MRKLILGVMAALLMVSGVTAQEVFFYDKARFVWDEPLTDAERVTAYVVSCGPSTGDYSTYQKSVDAPQLNVLVKEVVPGRGTYYCAVYATDGIDKSEFSNEVSGSFVTLIVAPQRFRLE
jgi:hypothetical protein